MNTKGSAAVFIIIGVLVAITIGVLYFRGNFNVEKSNPNPSPQITLSQDPKYKDVKEKYNLSEEQLQILSTVNPDDNQ